MSTNVSTLGMLLRTEAFYVTTSQQRWFKFAQLCTVFLFEEAIVWAVRVPHESKMTCYDEFQYSGMQRIIDVTVRSPPGKADTIELTIDKGRYILLKAVDPPMKEVFLNDIHALILGCYAELRARQRRKASYSQPVTLNAPFGVRGHRMRLKDWSHMSRRSITSVSSVEESASPSSGCCIPRFFPSPGIMNSLASDRLAGHNHSEPHTGSCGICRDLLPELTGQTSDNSDQSDTREVDDVANSDDELR